MLLTNLIGSFALASVAIATRFNFNNQALGFYETFDNPHHHSVPLKNFEAGRKYNQNFHAENGHKGSKGRKNEHHHEVVQHGEKGRELKKAHNSEHGGNSKSYLDEADHFGNFHKGRKSHKAGKFGEKKGHRKGHKTKGYHNKFFKDEYHKEHKFYDDHHKSGEFKKYGNTHSNYKEDEADKVDKSRYKSSYNEDKRGKEGFTDKGHSVDEHEGYNNKQGEDKYHDRYSKYGKKGENENGKRYGYKGGH